MEGDKSERQVYNRIIYKCYVRKKSVHGGKEKLKELYSANINI